MRLTKSTGHAIRILIDCACADEGLIKVAMLSERLQITPQNVFKIVNLLARAGLIEAVRGRNGGVRLARSPRDIRIGDVVRATEVTRVEIEDAATNSGRRGSTGVNRILDDALEAFIDVLDQHTLADMAKSRAAADGNGRRKGRGAMRTGVVSGPRYRRALHDSR